MTKSRSGLSMLLVAGMVGFGSLAYAQGDDAAAVPPADPGTGPSATTPAAPAPDTQNTSEEPKKNAEPVVSGAVSGPSTGAGLNYQINYALLRVLRLFPEVLSFPIRNPFIRIEPRVQRRKKGGGQLSLTLVNVANCFGSTSNKIRK